MNTPVRKVVLTTAMFLLLGCVDDWEPSGEDSSTDSDAQMDTMADPGPDTGTDTVEDSTTDPTVDTVTDPTVDTGPECGNGIEEEGEECDDGLAENSWEPNACRPDCTLPSCGDDVVDTDFGEICEGDMTEGCSTPCDIPGQRVCDPETCKWIDDGCYTETEICDSGCDDDGDGMEGCDDPDCACTDMCMYLYQTDFSTASSVTDWTSSVPGNMYVDSASGWLHTYLYVQDDGYIYHPVSSEDGDTVIVDVDFRVPASGLQYVQGANLALTTDAGDAVDWRGERDPSFDGRSIHMRLFYTDYTTPNFRTTLRAVDSAGYTIDATSAPGDQWGTDTWHHARLVWDGTSRTASITIWNGPDPTMDETVVDEVLDLSTTMETFDFNQLEIAVANRNTSYTNHLTIHWDNVRIEVIPAGC